MWQENGLKQPPFLRSFQSRPANVQSFADGASAPFGLAPGSVPEPYLASPETLPGSQPTYHIKVTATPVDVAEPGRTPYIVMGDPGGFRATTKDGKAIIHAHGDVSAAAGVTVRPLQYREKAFTHQNSLPEVVVNAPSMSELESQNSRGLQPQTLLMVKSGTPEQDEAALYSLRQAVERLGPAAAEGSAHRPVELIEAAAQSTHQAHSFSWILPSGDAVENTAAQAPAPLGEYSVVENGVPAAAGGKNGNFWQRLFGGRSARDRRLNRAGGRGSVGQQQGMPPGLDKLFQQASAEFNGENIDEERASYNTRHPDAERGLLTSVRLGDSDEDDAAGLPLQARPTVRYDGVEFATPQYLGRKKPERFKLYSIEVHQFIPTPNMAKPPYIRENKNPATDSLFAPMPLPFDPCNTGMIAPTLQQQMSDGLLPRLSDKVAHMFNQEIPVHLTHPGTSPSATISAPVGII